MPDGKKKDNELKWPNIIRIDREYGSELSVDWSKVKVLELDTENIVEIAELAPTVDNNPDLSKVKTVDIGRLIKQNRMQTMAFRAAKSFFEAMKPSWRGSPPVLMAQLVKLAEEFISCSDRIKISPSLYDQDEKRRHLVISLSMSKVIRHFSQAISPSNTERLAPVFDKDRPFYSTQDMTPWRNKQTCQRIDKAQPYQSLCC